MNITLYQLADEYVEALRAMAEMELDEQTVADTLEGLSGELQVKATNVAMFVRNLEATADAIKAAEQQMAARRKAIENRAKRIRDYIQSQMEKTGISKIECPYFKLAIRDNPPSVVVDNADAIPEEYMRQPETPPPAPDKKMIGDALKDGIEVPGVHLERSKRLEIK